MTSNAPNEIAHALRTSMAEADSLMEELFKIIPDSANSVFIARLMSNLMVCYGITPSRMDDMMNLLRAFHMTAAKEISMGKRPHWTPDPDDKKPRLQ